MRRELLVDMIVERFGPAYSRADIETLIDTFLDTIVEVLCKDKRVELRKFGTFELHKRSGRTARAPRTGKEYSLPDRYVPFFRPSKILKTKISARLKP